MAYRTLTLATSLALLLVALGWWIMDGQPSDTVSDAVSVRPTAEPIDQGWKPALERFRFRVQGEQRTAALHVPKGADPSTPMPLFVVFHGGKDSTARALTNHWSAMFDQGVILVFPNGQRAKPDEPAWKVDDPNDMRDVELTKALLTALQKEYAIDTERRYVAGFSNGGMQTMMLMCHASEWFAGAAVVHQTLHNHLAETCKPQRALPMLYIHGTADSQWSGRFFSRSADETFEWWSRHNGCKLRTLKRSALPDREDDGTVVERWRFGRCAGAHTEMLRIEGGGHSWPGSDYGGDDHCRDVDATDEITQFWRRHTALEG